MRVATWLRVLAVALVAVQASAADDPFPGAPENRWVYRALDDFRKSGLLTNNPIWVSRTRLPRREIAKATIATVLRIDLMFTELQAEIGALEGWPTSTESDIAHLRSELGLLRIKVDGLTELLTEKRVRRLLCLTFAFERDLCDLGIDVRIMRNQVVDWVPRVCVYPKVEEGEPWPEPQLEPLPERCAICSGKHEFQAGAEAGSK